MELQFYPPGYTPFVDSESCSATKWCAALTIDSLEADFNFANLNPNCEEPTNFAFLQTNGVPAGPPSPQIQFQTDVAASEFLCNVATGSGCTAPPIGSQFYPFWSLSFSGLALASGQTSCAWNFGNVLPRTLRTFGKDAQYGTPDVARFGGTIISAVQSNPEFASLCRGPF